MGLLLAIGLGNLAIKLTLSDISELTNALYLRKKELTEKVWHYLGQLNENDHYFCSLRLVLMIWI